MKSHLLYVEDQQEELLKNSLQVKSEVQIEQPDGLQGFNSILNTITLVMVLLLTMYFLFLIFTFFSCRGATKQNSLFPEEKIVKIIDLHYTGSASHGRRTLTGEKDHKKDKEGGVDKKWWLEDDVVNDKQIVSSKKSVKDQQEKTVVNMPGLSMKAKHPQKRSSSDLVSKTDNQDQQSQQQMSQNEQQYPASQKKGYLQQLRKILLDDESQQEQTGQNDIQSKNMPAKSDYIAHEQQQIKLLSLEQKESIIQHYMKEVKDKRSIFLQYVNQNNQITKQKSKLDKQIHKILVERYDFDNYLQQNTFCVILSSLNNAQNGQISRTLNSIFNQDYGKYHVVMMDMDSKDQTEQSIRQFTKNNQERREKLKLVKSQNKVQVAASFEGLKHCQHDEIVILMKDNHQMLSRQVFKLIDHTYQSDSASIVYANSYSLDAAKKQIQLIQSSPYDESQIFMNLYRDTDKRYGDFFTFNVNLAAQIEQELIKNAFQEYFKYTGNEALIVPLLELSCGKIAWLNEPLMLAQVDTSIINKDGEAREDQRSAIRREKKLEKCQ